MKFGLAFANVGRYTRPAEARAIAVAAEDAGFESLWTVEHVAVPSGYASEYPYSSTGRMPGRDSSSIPDPIVWLSFVAACTATIRLGTGILILPQRNPLIMAKEAATLDRLSGGRLVLGVGVGWLKEEFDAIGVPFEGRGRRTEDYVAAMRTLWSAEEAASYQGTDVGFREIWSRPRPDSGRIPVVIGGHSKTAARRAGLIGDGFFPGRGIPSELGELIAVMRQSAEDSGRDPAEIEITTGTPGVFGSDPQGAVEEMASMGVGRLVIPPPTQDPDAIAEVLGSFGENVIRKQ